MAHTVVEIQRGERRSDTEIVRWENTVSQYHAFRITHHVSRVGRFHLSICEGKLTAVVGKRA